MTEQQPDTRGRALLQPCSSTLAWERSAGIFAARRHPSDCPTAAHPSCAVVILFKQTGDAPILKQNKVKVRLGPAAGAVWYQPLQRGPGAAAALRCWPPPAASVRAVPAHCCACLPACLPANHSAQPLPAFPQIDGGERFAKLIEFLRKKLGREQVVR